MGLALAVLALNGNWVCRRSNIELDSLFSYPMGNHINIRFHYSTLANKIIEASQPQ